MIGDRETLALYDARAAEYAEAVAAPSPSPRLLAFIDALPAGGRALDLGCGPGADAAAMVAAGLEVDALDAAPGMVALARERHGIAARLGTFEDIDSERAYHGVWANFSLLHAPRRTMPGHLARLHGAMVVGGLLHVGLKAGAGEGRDALGRLYTYYAQAETAELLEDAGFSLVDRDSGRARGFDGQEAEWFVLWGRKL